VKSKVPVSFPFVAFPTGPPARASYQPVVHWSVDATDGGLLVREGTLRTASQESTAISSGHRNSTRSLAAGGPRWRACHPAGKESAVDLTRATVALAFYHRTGSAIALFRRLIVSVWRWFKPPARRSKGQTFFARTHACARNCQRVACMNRIHPRPNATPPLLVCGSMHGFDPG
jgi:hypothetical protein